MSCYVYLLYARTERRYLTYVGWTNDLEGRLAAHNSGTARGAKSTRGRQWRMVYVERLDTQSDAMRREYELKRDRKFRKSIADGQAVDP